MKAKNKKVSHRKTTALIQKLRDIKPLNFFSLTVAGIINAFGVTLFLFPVKLYDSGISGTSMLLDQVTPAYLTLPMFLFLLNIPIFMFGCIIFPIFLWIAMWIYGAVTGRKNVASFRTEEMEETLRQAEEIRQKTEENPS